MVRQKPAKLPFPSSNLGATFFCMLILVATPIGNLQDISPRAAAAIASADVVLCEDTRHTATMLGLLDITARQLVSLHRFNEKRREDEVMAWLHADKTVVLVSDAGTPGISDPGACLVARCHQERIQVSIIPGPCAFASAFAVTGVHDAKMQFLGFLPKAESELVTALQDAYRYQGATVVYESPQRIERTLALAAKICPTWEAVLVRELTKMHEEIVRAPVADLFERLKVVKGECTLVFLPCPQDVNVQPAELVARVCAVRASFQCSLKEAVKIVAEEAKVSQRELYKFCVEAASPSL